jgi:ribosomal protein S18 acetylase RimI-like enzyme
MDELQHGTQVWLYLTPEGEPVGFGSLAAASQRWPRAKDPQIAASLIPMLGVDRKYWGQPPGSPEDRYSARILDDLIAEASIHRQERPILILYVHVDNARGIRFYECAGFAELHKPYRDKRTGWEHKRMVLVLSEPAT